MDFFFSLSAFKSKIVISCSTSLYSREPVILTNSPLPRSRKSTLKKRSSNSKFLKRRKVKRRLESSTPGSPGSTTAGPNHSQKKSLIPARKER
ncbi:hypothetical protein RND71_012437 [Anisodus tanguticus]|uniref:Uncharacterized protein n=1 Tax=Anisodus tanguticus TaxID=243964 RepID=A0AAE1SF65_9SOLA|nr:hypothetical protein RND71_012437 [Anisodus tanguticus]